MIRIASRFVSSGSNHVNEQLNSRRAMFAQDDVRPADMSGLGEEQGPDHKADSGGGPNKKRLIFGAVRASSGFSRGEFGAIQQSENLEGYN